MATCKDTPGTTHHMGCACWEEHRNEAMNGTLALVFLPEPHGAFTVEIPGAHAGDEVAVTVRLVKSGAKPGEEQGRWDR